MAVLAVLASVVVPRYSTRVDQAREVTLKQNLVGLRTALDQFNRDKGRYPNSLEELVTSRYIRAIPLDPITDRADSWVPVLSDQTTVGGSGTAPPGGIFDVRSGAQGQAMDGSSYATW